MGGGNMRSREMCVVVTYGSANETCGQIWVARFYNY